MDDLLKELEDVKLAVQKLVASIQDAMEDGRLKLREVIAIAKVVAEVAREVADILVLLQPLIYKGVADVEREVQ